MRVEQPYLNRVRAKLKELQALETRLEHALTKEYPDFLEDERGAFWAEYERLTGPSDEDDGYELQNPEEIRKLLEPIYERMKQESTTQLNGAANVNSNVAGARTDNTR